MKKLIIILFSVIILLGALLLRYKFHVTPEGKILRINRITGNAKLFTEYDFTGIKKK